MARRDPRRVRGGGRRLRPGTGPPAVPAFVERPDPSSSRRWWSASPCGSPVGCQPAWTGGCARFGEGFRAGGLLSGPGREAGLLASMMATEDGREFRAVRASEDVRFDDPEKGKPCPPTWPGTTCPSMTWPARQGRRVGWPSRRRGPQGPLLSQPDGPARHLAGAEEGLDGDGLHPRLRRGGRGRERRDRLARQGPAHRRADRDRGPAGGGPAGARARTVTLDERRVTVIAPGPMRTSTTSRTSRPATASARARHWSTSTPPRSTRAAAQLIANPGFDGARRRLQNLNVSEAVIDEMERTRKVPMAITWSSARDGIVLQRTAIEGMKAAPATPFSALATSRRCG